MKTVGLVSLGCAKNRIDSEMILAMFPIERFTLVNTPETADFIIVNTCGFIGDAKTESIDTIFEMAKYKGKLIVVGCLAERYYEQLKAELPEADLIVPIRDYKELSSRLSELTGEEITPISPLRRILSTGPYSAYLRISEGCDNHCAFCAIPFIRGRFVSRPFDEIITEAKWLKQKGIQEISLISQDTTVYGKDFPHRKPDLCDLLREIEKVGFYSIRLLYLYPTEISDELIHLIANSKTIAHYFDIPVQCASDKQLKAMRRHSLQKETEDLFLRIKEICPDAILRTTLIAGFPGENETDQKKTIAFLKKIRFDHMGVFPYSREEGTAGDSLPHHCREATKARRVKELLDVQRSISYENNKTHVGEIMEGIVIARGKKKDEYQLRSYWNAPDDIDGTIYFTSQKPLEEGDIVKVKITFAMVYDLFGEIVE